MYMNCAATGMETILLLPSPILLVLQRALSACCVAAAGAAMPGTVGWPIATALRRRVVATAMVCALPLVLLQDKERKAEKTGKA